MVVMTLIAAAGEFDLEHRQSGTSHSVLSSLQKVSGNDDDDDDDDDGLRVYDNYHDDDDDVYTIIINMGSFIIFFNGCALFDKEESTTVQML